MNANKSELLEPNPVTMEVERSVLDELLAAESPHRPTPAQDGPLIGILSGFTESGRPLVLFGSNATPSPAMHTCAITAADVGREVVLMFESGVRRPIILGLLQPPVQVNSPADARPVNVTIDGEQITLAARNEIVLRCGKASITLTRAGKVLIRGAYLLSRSSGANRIKGGSVQIN